MLSRDIFRRLGTWTNIMGIFNIVTGVLGIITLVGIIPGIINLILGLKLTATKRSIDGLLAQPEGEDSSIQLNEMADNLGTFFMINAITMLIGLGIGLLVAVIMIALIIARAMSLGNY
jgi:hypothetical protein